MEKREEEEEEQEEEEEGIFVFVSLYSNKDYNTSSFFGDGIGSSLSRSKPQKIKSEKKWRRGCSDS